MAKAKISMDIRRQLAEKYGCKIGETVSHLCSICGEYGNIKWVQGYTKKGKGQVVFSFEIDHVIPESKGGLTHISNLQLICRKCNRTKGAKHG